jgi:hypothetical protein
LGIESNGFRFGEFFDFAEIVMFEDVVDGVFITDEDV